MQINCVHGEEGTVVYLSRTPTDTEKDTILQFLGNRGFFIDTLQFKEFFIKKHLEQEDILRYFKAYNLFTESSYSQKQKSYEQRPIKSPTLTSHDKDNYILAFGCHRNKPLNKVPDNYLKWLAGVSADPELVKACNEELKERNTIIISR